jgi:hypothetical protein
MVSLFLFLSSHFGEPSIFTPRDSGKERETGETGEPGKGDGEAREEIANDQAPRLELIRAVRG